MQFLTVVVIIVAIIALYLLKQKRETQSGTSLPIDTPLPYKKKDYVLTRNERAFYDALLPVVSGEYHVFTKMRMIDLFFLPKGTQNRMGWNGRIIQKHVDFVLCDTKNLKPVLAIEVDDSSHDEEDRQERDAFIDRVFGAAGLPLLHIQASGVYTPSSIKTQISSALVPTNKLA